VTAGKAADLAQTRQDLDARDGRDRTRETAPLVTAPDAIEIDTTKLSVDQVVDHMTRVIGEKEKAAGLA